MNENIETKIIETFTNENKMEEDEDSSIYDNHIEKKIILQKILINM